MTKTLLSLVSAATIVSAMSLTAAAAAPVTGLGVKWCEGEWHCDKFGCVCVVTKTKGGGTVNTLSKLKSLRQ